MEAASISYTREELFEKVWAEPMIKLAKSFNISDVGLRKKCKKFNIPLPPQGYWVKKQFGKTMPRPALPPYDGDDKIEFATNNDPKKPECKEESEEVKTQIAFEQLPENKIRVPVKLNSPHQLIVRFKEALQNTERYELDRGCIVSKGGEVLDIKVSRDGMDRALRIMDTLIKALEMRGYMVTVAREDAQSGACIYRTAAAFLKETIAFSIREGVTQKKHVPEQDPKKKGQLLPYSYPAYDYSPSGVLAIAIKEYVGGDVRLVWADGKKQKLEECLNNFIVGLVRTAVAKRVWRLERERQQRELREREIARWKIEEQIRKEDAELKVLLEEAENWNKSKLIRTYIKAVTDTFQRKQGVIEQNSKLARWIEWASRHADRLDPLMDG